MSADFNPGDGWRRLGPDDGLIGPGETYIVLHEPDGDTYFVREVPVPPLPTEPGYYLTTEPDYGGGPVVVELLNSPAGQWVDAGDREYLNHKQVEDMLPLARLEPAAVTAKAVLDRIEECLPLGFDDPSRVQLKGIAREFGVES